MKSQRPGIGGTQSTKPAFKHRNQDGAAVGTGDHETVAPMMAIRPVDMHRIGEKLACGLHSWAALKRPSHLANPGGEFHRAWPIEAINWRATD
jgi:hypothetical protein